MSESRGLLTEEQSSVDARGQQWSAELLHDLRTPLNQILGYSEMLIEQAIEEGQNGFLSDLQKIHTAGRQLLALLLHRAPSLPDPEALVESPQTIAATDPSPWELEAAARVEPSVRAPLPSCILIVDDSKTNRDMLSRRLERQGYGVARAESGPQALEMMGAQEFDLVLLDIMMPEMDGFAVLQKLKADEALRHVSVIMISALDELESVARCIEMGAEDYLPKPSNPTLFKARIEACLERKHARDREQSLFQQLEFSTKRLAELEKRLDQAGL